MRNFIISLLFLGSLSIWAQNTEDNDDKSKDDGQFTALTFRSIGPAFTSGRIADFAVNPDNPSEYYVGVAAGGIWKTTNNGTTFSPVFDKYGVYSIGCLTMDPKNHNVVWAGTGENNHQRSLSYGDGVYKTVDGGKSWKNMGLKESRQIGMIAIDPRDSRIVFVAAEGSVWGPGGDRGLYKTTDGGKTWNKVLNISEHTGVNNVVIDPVNPDVMYATSEQRRRHTHIRIGGGPESNLYKSTDAGETWRKITSGLPNVDKGGMGIAISPVDHNRVYLIVEAAMGKGGFFQSNDQGESWEKMSDYNTSGQYYGEIICHPSDINTIYATETFTKVSHDAGKTWKNLGNNKRHVDDHALWIDPQNNEHLLIGGDGGVYETFDHGKNFIYKSNLPVTQFYRVNVDNDYPFYNVYGGTQDNNSFGGPSQSLFKDGTMRDEWVITLGGDGFWQAIDPMDPNIVYSEYQYGNLYRYDKKSGEKLFIKPMPKAGENTYKWNWDTPFIISLHNHKRLYMVADKVFRSDDRGEHWKVISGDITQNIPRDQWPVMGRYWGVDAVEKNVSTSLYGMGVSLAESPVKEGLLYVGTDDGTIQVKEGNNDWRKITHFSGVPDNTYVTDILPSKFDENVVFATFNNHKRDDFKPYVLMSTNKGKSWRSISGNLPENGSVHTIEQDFINPDLLFVGTEFGVFYSLDKGKKWIQIKGGIPTIAVKDMVIQTRDNDLVLATFGRGFYILDNYSALREWDDNLKQQKAHIFKVEDALLYIPKRRGGSWGSTPYVAKNPEYGAHFTYYLKDKFQSAQDKRRESEKELIKDKQPIPIPSPKELYDEEHEFKPYILFSITDEEGQVIKRLRKPAKKGLGQLHWNLEYSMDYPIKPLKDFNASDDKNDRGIYVLPGKYFIKMDLVNAEGITPLVENTAFNVTLLDHATFPADDAQERADFLAQLKELARVAYGNKALFSELVKKTNSMMKAALESQDVPMSVIKDIQKVQEDLTALKWQMFGEEPKASYEEIKPAEMSVFSRLSSIIYTYNSSNANITQAQKDSYTIIKTQLKDIIKQLKDINEQRMPMIEQSLDRYKSPWTSGRVLEFNE